MNVYRDGNKHTHHTHKCFTCGLVWDHDPILTDDNIDEINALPRSEYEQVAQQNNLAHSCLQCGTTSFFVYNGDRPSVLFNNGLTVEKR